MFGPVTAVNSTKRRTLGIGALLTLIDLISMATGFKRPVINPRK